MAKFKTYGYPQRVLLPVSWAEQLMPGTNEFHHDESLDQYLCPGGKILNLEVKQVLNPEHLYRKYLPRKKIAGLVH
jgi:hypothetical protein